MSNKTHTSFATLDPAVSRIHETIRVLITGAGILGNIWSLAATVTSNVFHSKINVLIALLALADLLACDGFLVVRVAIAFDIVIIFFRTASSTSCGCIIILRSHTAATSTYPSQRFAMSKIRSC